MCNGNRLVERVNKLWAIKSDNNFVDCALSNEHSVHQSFRTFIAVRPITETIDRISNAFDDFFFHILFLISKRTVLRCLLLIFYCYHLSDNRSYTISYLLVVPVCVECRRRFHHDFISTDILVFVIIIDYTLSDMVIIGLVRIT